MLEKVAVATLSAVLMGAAGLMGACDSRSGNDSDPPTSTGSYRNPVVKPVAADPSVIRGGDGRFYLFATSDDWGDGEGTRLLPIFSSENLIEWDYAGNAFDRRPRWKSTGGGLWAPDVSFVGGTYRLYYAYSKWGDPNPCIGVAFADDPLGPWVDAGEAVFCSDDIGVENSIDPFVWHADGRSLIIWGSFYGIYAVALSENGSSVAAGASKKRIADERFEAPYVIRREDRYYLFVSAGTCCDGASSTYRVYVGRSDSLTGPYVDAQGRDLRSGGGMLLLGGNDAWAGPGHNSIIVDDAGNDWIVYHAIPSERPMLESGANRRPALIDRLKWTSAGWPYLDHGVPDTTSRSAPVLLPPL